MSSKSIDPNDAASSSERGVQLRACTNCVRAKAKCASNDIKTRGTCQRCHRMNKACEPSPPVRKRRMVTKPTASQTAQLEEKIDGLVTLVKSATQAVPVISNTVSMNTPLETLVSPSHQSIAQSTAASTTNHNDHSCQRLSSVLGGLRNLEYTPLSSAPSRPPSRSFRYAFDPVVEPGAEEAEIYLNIFRTDFIDYLPFLVIPSTTKECQLRQTRPILWMCIMTVASNNATQQIALSKQILEIFGKEAFIEGTRNMDFLLAVLVYAAWYQHRSFERPNITSLVQLSIAILYDLCLDKAASSDPSCIIAYDVKGVRVPARQLRSPTMEERRVLLGCFLVSSGHSCWRKGESLRWTAFGDECLQLLEVQKEVPEDALLVQLVKLHLIVEQTYHAPWSSTSTEVDASVRAPAMMFLKSLETQLQHFKANIPSHLSDNKVLLMEFHTADIKIHDLALSPSPSLFSAQYNGRLECLYAGLKASKSWVEVFLSIPPAKYIGMSVLIYGSMARCLINIYRLAIFQDPCWDHTFVTHEIDVGFLLQQLSDNFSAAKKMGGHDVGGGEDIDGLSITASAMRRHKLMWDGMCEQAAAGMGMVGALGIGGGHVGEGDFSASFMDTDWMHYFFDESIPYGVC